MLAGGALAAVWMLPDDTDNARATSPEMLAAFADPPGKGVLDGLRFDTEMGVQGKPAELKDFVQFDQGLFIFMERAVPANATGKPVGFDAGDLF